MCYNSVREISVLLALNFKAGTASVAHSSDLNMEVQNGPENFMGLSYAFLFFRRFRNTHGRYDPDCG